MVRKRVIKKLLGEIVADGLMFLKTMVRKASR